MLNMKKQKVKIIYKIINKMLDKIKQMLYNIIVRQGKSPLREEVRK